MAGVQSGSRAGVTDVPVSHVLSHCLHEKSRPRLRRTEGRLRSVRGDILAGHHVALAVLPLLDGAGSDDLLAPTGASEKRLLDTRAESLGRTQGSAVPAMPPARCAHLPQVGLPAQ